MKKKFTFLIAAAVMLLTMMATTGTMWGQSDYSTNYTGNVTLSTDGGSNASACVIVIGGANYNGIKAGTSKNAGAVKITVPSGTKYLHLHLAAWNNETVSLAVTPTGYSDNIALTNNSGISNNSPFTFNGDPSTSDYYKVITFANAMTADTDLTFTATGGKRFVVWGVTSEEDGGGGETPSITAANVEIAYDATYGEIEYSINNPVDYGWIEPTTTADWLDFGNVEEDKVNFVCDPNQNATARTATVTLTYNYNAKAFVTKNVTVTQAGNPNAVDNISDITATGSYTVQGTIVAKSTRGFIVGDGTGYVYYYNTNYNQDAYNIGDKVKLAGNVSVYGGVFQFPSSTTITSVETSNYQTEDPTVLSGADMDARVASTTPPQLSNYVQYVGKLTVSGNYYNITDIEGATTAKGSISYPINNDFISLDGKRVTVTGYYVGISSSTYYNTMIGSIEEVISEDPYIIAENVNLTYDATSGLIEYEIQNYVAGTMVATTEATWISDITIDQDEEFGEVGFTTTQNTAAAERTATVTLTYSYGDNQTVTKDVTVTQSGNPNIFNNIEDITEVGTAYSVKGTVVAVNSKGFIMGDGTGYVYTYLNAAPTVEVGDMITVSGTTGSYGHIIQFTSSATIAEATTSNYDGTPEVTVITEVPDYSEGYYLATYLQFEGGLTKSGSNYLVAVGQSQIRISYPTTEQGNELADLENKTVRVHGFFSGISGSGTNAVFTTTMESIEEVVVTTPSITVAPATVNAPFVGAEGTLTITYENIPDLIAFDILFCDANGDELQGDDPNWIYAEITDPTAATENYTVSYIIDANDGEARNAYFKVYTFVGANLDPVYSNLITVNQAEYVAPSYAELPFAFNGGKADIENTDGLSQEGLGSDYNSAPKLKFDGTGDWLLLQFDERPGTLTFDIKGNSFSGGTFTVQTSEDGITYTDLESYTELGDTQSESFNTLGENVRYIKWIYTEKSSGNVGLGNIALAAYAEPTASITVDPAIVNVTAAGEENGSLAIAYEQLTITDPADFDIQYYNANNEPLDKDDEPDWMAAAIQYTATQQGFEVSYSVDPNNGDARTAYFKVYAMDDNTELVYSNLVTLTQEAYVAPTATITVADGDANIDVDANGVENATLAIAYEYLTITDPADFDIQYYNANNEPLGKDDEPDWMAAAIQYTATQQGFEVSYSVDPNDGDARTAYFKVYALDNNSELVYSNLVTINQAALVVDYATLPFEWAGGTTANFNALNGASTSGVGDYGDNQGVYRMKLDGTGDYIQVKTDEQPGVVTIGVKMIGGASTSTLTVQGSANGETFTDVEELTISGAQNDVLTLETTNDFTADDRYVRLLFTKGSNVGVGPITITKYSTNPVINAEDVDLAYNATQGEIAYTIIRPVASVALQATTTADWISDINVTDEKVIFNTTENTGDEDRVATFTLSYTGAEDKVVTVTQAHFVVDYAELPFEFTGSLNDIASTVGLTQEGLGSYSNVTTNLKFAATDNYLVLKVNAAPASISYDIKGNSFSGGTFTLQVSENGSDYVNLVNYNDLSGTIQRVTAINNNENVRYVRWYYTEKVNGNVGLGNIYVSDQYDIAGNCSVEAADLDFANNTYYVDNNAILTINGDFSNTDYNSIIVADGGQLVFDSPNVSATIIKTVEVTDSKSGEATDWYTIASPLNETVTTSSSNTTLTYGLQPEKYDLYRYNETTMMWENSKEGANSTHFTDIEAGRGYLYWVDGGRDVYFTGKLNNAAVTYPLTASGSGNLKGFNLIGNPYSQNITKSNITLSAGDPLSGGYILSKDGAWSAEVGEFKPCQGFLVQVSEPATATISKLSSSSKSDESSNYIGFKVANSQYEDVTYALFENSNGLNKINHRNAEIPMIYVAQEGNYYAIATMDDNKDMFNLNFKAMTTGLYTLTMDVKGKYNYIHVIDRLTGEDIDMLLDGEYSFIGSPRDNDARFIVKLNANANIDEIETCDIFAYQNGSDIIVNGEGELQIFDMMGRFVRSINVNGTESINAASFANDVYVFRMVGETIKTQKIVVR